MAIKCAGDDGELGALNKLRTQNGTKIMSMRIDSNDNDGDDGAMKEEMEESFHRDLANLKETQRLNHQMHLRAWEVVMLA